MTSYVLLNQQYIFFLFSSITWELDEIEKNCKGQICLFFPTLSTKTIKTFNANTLKTEVLLLHFIFQTIVLVVY